jgi:uncharacterized membrane protein
MPLNIRLRDELLVINILTIVLILITVFLPLEILRIIFGLPVALFFPGYTLIAVLFPHKDDLNTLERVALSFGLSIALVALIGLILSYTPWGIQLYSVLFAVTLFIVATSVVASLRRRQLSPEERFSVSFGLDLSGWVVSGRMYRGLSIILILAILGSLGMLVYAIGTREVGEKYTQFYVLGMNGKPEGYPVNLEVGEKVEVILGIVNQEGEDMSYRVRVAGDGISGDKIESLFLADQEKWEHEISFIPTRVGENQKVEFLLYKQAETSPYRELHLWIDVTE